MGNGAVSATRRAGRALAALALLSACAAGAAWLGRAALAERGGEAALGRLGLRGAEVTVRALGPRMVLLDASVPDGPSATVRATYDLAEVWRDRRVREVRVTDAALTVTAGPGGVRIEGLDGLEPPGGEGGGAAPFGALVVEDAALTLATPGGTARGTVSGAWDGAAGRARLRLTGDAGMAGTAATGTVAGDASMGADGALAVTFGFDGTVTAGGRTAEGVSLTVELAGTGWQAPAEAEGSGRVTLTSARTALGDAPLSLSGRAALSLSDGVLRADPVVTAARDDGARAEVLDGFAVSFGLTDRAFAARGPIAFDVSQGAGTARVDWAGGAGTFAAALSRAEVAGMAFGAARWDGTVALSDSALLAEGEGAARLSRWAVGPVTVRDVPARGAVSLRYGLADGATTLRVPGCLTAPAATAAVDALTVRLEAVQLCADDALFASEGSDFAASGTLRADAFATEIAGRAVTGTDAALPFAAGPEGASGALSVAAMALPADLAATGVRVSGRTTDAGLAFTLDRARVAQAIPAPLVSPVVVTGAGLAGEAIRFDGALATPGGAALAEVALRQAGEAGEATLTADGIAFAPDGLQPAALLPALRGVVSGATGRVSGSARAAWDGDAPPETSARLVLDDLSFRGPGLTVQRTAGLSGTVTLDSLLPVRSAGVQDLSAELIDLGAIKLPRGEALFTLPGDGTLELISAAFPWMGGRLSVADATLAMGGSADAVLRVEGAEIAQLLGVLDVDGLSGEGVLDGALPLRASAFAITIDGGAFESRGPGVIRYAGRASAAVQANQGAKLAFSALEELRFERLSGTVAGPLDGTLTFGLRMEGTSRVDLGDPRVTERLVAPVIYTIDLEAPILALIDQARLSTDYCRQLGETGATEVFLALGCVDDRRGDR